MSRILLFLCVLTLSAAVGIQAATYQEGTVASMDSVPCGTQFRSHSRSQEMLCQQYVVRTAGGEYQIRREKQNSANLLPVGHEIEFRIDKDHMLVKGFTVNGKKIKDQKYLVVSYNGHEYAEPETQ